MKTKKDVEKIWAVIVVRRGILNSISLFRNEDAAYHEYNFHASTINPEDDDIQILNIPIDERNIVLSSNLSS